RRSRAHAKQAIENDQWSGRPRVRLRRDYFLRGGQLVCDVRPRLDKSNAEIGIATGGCRRSQNLRWSAAQIFEFLAHELAEIVFFESKPDFDFPAEASQAISGNQSVACVMTFSGEHNAFAGPREKLRDCLCNTGASVVHERFNLHSPVESGLFCRSHLRRRQNRQVQIRPPDLLRRSVLLSRLIAMSFSFYARFSCVNAWTCGVRMQIPSFDRCTAAAGLFRSSPLASWTAHLQRNCVRRPQLQFPLRVSGGKKQFARTRLRLDS